MNHYTDPRQQGWGQATPTPKPLPPGYRPCDHCGTPFGSGHGSTRYCSESCCYYAMMDRRKGRKAGA